MISAFKKNTARWWVYKIVSQHPAGITAKRAIDNIRKQYSLDEGTLKRALFELKYKKILVLSKYVKCECCGKMMQTYKVARGKE